MKNFYKCTLIAVSLALITAAGLASCTPEDQTGLLTQPTKKYDVYVAGTEENDSGYEVATLWKNGKAIPLTTDEFSYSEANSVCVAGDIVYVAGSDFNVATLWTLDTDGVIQTIYLTSWTDYSWANSVCVAGDIVYIAGKEEGVATLWTLDTDGVIQTIYLTDGASTSSANSVCVAEDIVYIAGYEANKNGPERLAKLWVYDLSNEAAKEIDLYDLENYSGAYSVFVAEDIVYVAGEEFTSDDHYGAKLWKIGTDLNTNDIDKIDLTDVSGYAWANSVCVAEDIVYVAGYEESDEGTGAKLWKIDTDDTIYDETYLTDGGNFSDAYSVCVAGDDVYVAGYEENDDGIYVAKWWKSNSQTISLTDGSNDAWANSIFVKER